MDVAEIAAVEVVTDREVSSKYPSSPGAETAEQSPVPETGNVCVQPACSSSQIT